MCGLRTFRQDNWLQARATDNSRKCSGRRTSGCADSFGFLELHLRRGSWTISTWMRRQSCLCFDRLETKGLRSVLRTRPPRMNKGVRQQGRVELLPPRVGVLRDVELAPRVALIAPLDAGEQLKLFCIQYCEFFLHAPWRAPAPTPWPPIRECEVSPSTAGPANSGNSGTSEAQVHPPLTIFKKVCSRAPDRPGP
jgi:hypothetical protein